MGHDKRYVEFEEKTEEGNISLVVIPASAIVSVGRKIQPPSVPNRELQAYTKSLNKWNNRAEDDGFGWDDDDDSRDGKNWEEWLKNNPKPIEPVASGESIEEVFVRYTAGSYTEDITVNDDYETALGKWTDGAEIVS